jgi:hypothetical protein
MIVTLPAPNAFPIGTFVRAGEHTGEVVELLGPYSVVIREPSGRRLTTTTSDMALDAIAMPTPATKPVAPVDLFSFLEG